MQLIFHSAANNMGRGHVFTGHAEMCKLALAIQTLKLKH